MPLAPIAVDPRPASGAIPELDVVVVVLAASDGLKRRHEKIAAC